MATVNIKGDIIPNDLTWVYEWFGFDHTSPAMVKTVIDGAAEGETIDVIINSGGGYVMAGQEIYTELTKNPNVNIEIQSLAGSAASVIAMAGHSRISPVGMIMIHNVSGRSEGDYHDMQKSAEILKNTEWTGPKCSGSWIKRHGSQPISVSRWDSAMRSWAKRKSLC